MAIGWLTVLQNVPWTDVIANAPKVAEGAKKLWGAVRKSPAAAEAGTATPQTDAARIAALEAGMADLNRQLLESAAIITSLAEQNAQLVQRIEANRRRLAWLAALSGIAIVLAAVALVMVRG
jgi:hypothetical protein